MASRFRLINAAKYIDEFGSLSQLSRNTGVSRGTILLFRDEKGIREYLFHSIVDVLRKGGVDVLDKDIELVDPNVPWPNS